MAIITLFDIPSVLRSSGPGPEKDEDQAWSPNTWKARYALNVKGLAFKTEWIEYPNIEAFYKERGIPSVNTKPDGSPFYTLPVIHDESTGKYIVDSYEIVVYLDDQYPNTPTLLPKGTCALQIAFEEATQSACAAMRRLIMPATYEILREESQSYFYRTKGIEELRLPEDKVDMQWKMFEAGLGVVDGWLKKNGEGQKFVAGHSISYADITLAARLLRVKKVFDGKKALDGNSHGSTESKEWELVQGWHGGRWARLVAEFKQYE